MEFEKMTFILPAILHGIGMYILFKIRKARLRNRSQYLCLCHMGFVEFLISLIFVSSAIKIPAGIRLHLEILKDGVLMNWFLLIMLMLTFDRFMEIYFNIKYDLVWSARKTRICLLIAPLCTFTITAVVYALSYKNLSQLFPHYIALYVWSTLNLATLAAITITYTYILYKIKQSRGRADSTLNAVDNDKTSTNKSSFKYKLKRKIYTPTFLIISFLLFCFIPDNISFYHSMNGIKTSDGVIQYIVISHALEFTIDAVIYIIASKDSRDFVRKSVRKQSWGEKVVKSTVGNVEYCRKKSQEMRCVCD